MKKIYALFLYIGILIAVFPGGCFAQDASDLPQVIGPSPNVASLGKFGDIEVGTYTGVPNISIPIYEVVSGDIKVPISISYHASGIKGG